MLVGGGYEIPPMPTDEAELNAKFEEIVEELDLTDAKKAVSTEGWDRITLASLPSLPSDSKKLHMPQHKYRNFHGC